VAQGGYLTGFGNHHATEAVPGALPIGRNSPQKPAFGLYAEQLSGTAFTAPRHENRRSWLYRMRPSAEHPAYRSYPGAPHFRADPAPGRLPPDRFRWSPLELPSEPTDLLDGIVTMVANRAPEELEGVAVHIYRANRDNERRFLLQCRWGDAVHSPAGAPVAADGDGPDRRRPRRGRAGARAGCAFARCCRTARRGDTSRRNYGALLRLPDLGPIGANGLANPRDFETPVAAYEDRDEPVDSSRSILARFGERSSTIHRSTW
jgi:homogentisate 1,2-dioxygenase